MDQYRIKSMPATMFYIPNFISEDEETTILSSIPENRWVALTHRRLQAVPSRLTATNTLLASALPKWLTNPVVERIHNLGLFKDAPHGINHCLINEYLPGQGIMPHEDGEAYHSITATVSLQGTIVLDVTQKANSSSANGDSQETQSWRIVQEPRSLLVTLGSAYSETLHGIAQVEEDIDLTPTTVANWSLLGDSELIGSNGGRNIRTPRISLTYRDVKKVSNIGNKLFGKKT